MFFVRSSEKAPEQDDHNQLQNRISEMTLNARIRDLRHDSQLQRLRDELQELRDRVQQLEESQ